MLKSAALFTLLSTFALAADTPSDPGAVFAAIRADRLNTLRDLRSKGVDINAPGERSTPPLTYAAAFGSIAAMRILLDAGADVNAKTAFGATALHWATHAPEKMRLLLSKGADANAATKSGRTPLILAAYNNPSEEAVTLLLEKGANVKAKDAAGITALLAATSSGRRAVAQLLVEKGSDLEARDRSGSTALMNAASNGDVDLIRYLIAHGANVNAVGAEPGLRVKNGPIPLGRFTALLLASTYGPPEAVEVLLDHGADIQSREARGMTALHLAVSTESLNPRTIRLLIDKGVDTSAKMATGETAAQWAVKMGRFDAVALLGKSDGKEARPAAALAAFSSTPVSGPQVRSAATRAIALLQVTSASFFVQGGCSACHAQDMTGFAAGIARDHGIAVDGKLLEEQTRQVRAQWKAAADALLERQDMPGGSDMNGYALLGLASVGEKPDRYTDAMVRNAADVQLQSGAWSAGGFSRVPVGDSVIGTTVLGLRALQLYGTEASRPEFDLRVAKARDWLLKAPAVYADDRAWLLLGLKWSGAPEPAIRAALQTILAQQRKDGGWSQNAWLESDAYATGQALYALSVGGSLPSTDQAFARGIAWLVRTQGADGSWHVRSRAVPFQPYFESGFPHSHDQWISSFGTAWAAAVLSMSVQGTVAEAR